MTLKLNFNSTAEDILQKAKREISRVGGTLDGNDSGEFSVPTKSGVIKGNYKVQSNLLEIDITDKPSFVSKERIEQELNKYLS